MYPAMRKTPLRGLIVGAVLMLVLVLLVGNPFGKFAASRKSIAEAQVEPPPSPAGSGEEYAGGAQPTPAATSSARPTTPAVTGNVADKPLQLRKLVQTSSASRTTRPASSSSLDLSVQHQFKDATLSLWIDDNLTLTQPLHGTVRKHLIVFNGIYGANSKTVQVPVGVHEIRLRAQSADQSVDLSKTISAVFTDGDTKTLQVTFNNHNTAINLIWR
jgi:hypothetical protein